jgi:hypothetical protein
MSAGESRWLAIAIPISELILIKCNFFLDTIFLGFYTFVNCKVSLAGSMSTRQRENRNNGNQESSSKEASEEGSQENSKEEVSRQRNRQHNRGTPKASPEVFLVEVNSSVFMRFPRATHARKELLGHPWALKITRAASIHENHIPGNFLARLFSCLPRAACDVSLRGRRKGGDRARRDEALGQLSGKNDPTSYQSGTGSCHLQMRGRSE